MASRAAILRAARAGSPGAGQPTPPPQGSGSPWIGQLPSYTTEPGAGYSYNYGPFLPRPGDVFTQGAFGPMSPILPVPVDTPPPGLPRAQPRRWQPYPGYNLPVGQPGTEGYKLASFATLKTLSETYSILRTCLERRKNEIRALDWDIMLTPDAAKSYQGDAKAMRDFWERRAKAKKFFKRPDPNYFTFEAFVHAMMDQVFTIDALSLYQCPKKGAGLGRGMFGSDLDCVWLIDGSSIRPLMGLHGEVPLPPAPAAQQYEFGVPRADLTTMVAGLDLNGDEGRLISTLRGDQFVYHPYLQRVDSPYGFSLVEQALIPIMTGLRKQAMQLDYFSENTTPRVYISPGDSTLTPNQIRELQDALNAVAGDLSWMFKVQVLPPGSKVMPVKDMEIVDQADEWIATEVAMVCDISPMELGILPKISTVASPFAAREMAQANRAIRERTATKPTLAYVQSVFNFILQDVCGQDDLQFVFEGMQEVQDQAAMTDMLVKQVQSGLRSIDEARDELHLTPWDEDMTRQPIILTQMGPVPLDDAVQQSLSNLRQAITGGIGDPAAQQAVEQVSRHAVPAGGRKALPAGTSGQGRMNGPVTQRQARRGGALAPAHATAEGSPGHSGSSPPVKAAAAELEALSRHLTKGMPLSEWVPVHLPGQVMASIGQDLESGLSAAYAVKAAASLLPKVTPAERERRRERRQQQQPPVQQQMAAISARYATAVHAALQTALAEAARLVAGWVAGTLAVTAAVLAGLILEALRQELIAALTQVWTAAWQAAEEYAGGSTPDGALEAWLATEGDNWAQLISGTGEQEITQAIKGALAAGDTGLIMERLGDIIDAPGRAELITDTEITRAWNAALALIMKVMGLTWRQWNTRNDNRVCATCKANQDQGPVTADKPFKSGLYGPPQHPRCRCWLTLAEPPKAGKSAKVLRREVGLNGQETWTEWEPAPETTGGRVFYPHRADGTQFVPQGGVPGSSAGGEPPRWDGSEPFPYVERAPDADDDADYGDASGLGSPPRAYWPASYMDGWWPAPHGHGMTQPPSSSPGARTGRPPNGVGKARDAAAKFLKDAPQANPNAVFRLMQQNFPPSALKWVKKLRWVGPVDVPVELIETGNRDSWAASHEQNHVDDLARKIRTNQHVNPIIGVIRAGHNHVRLIDGRHRTLAAEKTGKPVRAYIAYLDDANEKAAYDTYLKQFHSGDDPRNKSFTAGNLGLPGSVSGLTPFNLLGGKSDDMEAFQDRGEPWRERFGIDGTAGDAQNIPHPFVRDGDSRHCVVCGMGRSLRAHACQCCAGKGEHPTGHECYRCDAGMFPTAQEWDSPFCEQVFRDPAVHAKGCPHCGPGPVGVRKSARPRAPYVGGLAMRASDTGRVLMIQRAITDDDPAAGLFEFPGGHMEDGEEPYDAALREWSEEVGRPAPLAGEVTGHWQSGNGIYEGFVLTIPREDDLDLKAQRSVENPDGDFHEPAVWWDPALIDGNPAVRPEIRQDWQLIAWALAADASKSARTPMLESTPHILGPEGLWHTPDRHVPGKQKLPDYIEQVAGALMDQQGMGEQQAIATAINAIKRWARGDLHWGRGKVTPEVRAASQRALAEWDRLKESHH